MEIGIDVMNDEPATKFLGLEHWPLARLVPSPRNARTHSDAQVAEIAGSIRTFGFANPILVSEEGDIIAGHGRLAAARQLGLTEVPVIKISGLNEVQRRQLMLADNRIALNAGWDAEMLQLELKDLSLLGANLSVLGFTEKELKEALSPAFEPGLTDEDDVPDRQPNPVSRPGDIWQLGPHRLGCGDSTDSAAVGAVLGDQQPALMVTDPPYGVDYDPSWRHAAGVNRSERTGRVKNDERADWAEAWALFPGGNSLRLARRLACGDSRRKPIAQGIYYSRSDYLGEATSSHRTRRLSLATRAMLVRGAQQRQLDGRSQTNDVVGDFQPRPGQQNSARNSEAG